GPAGCPLSACGLKNASAETTPISITKMLTIYKIMVPRCGGSLLAASPPISPSTTRTNKTKKASGGRTLPMMSARGPETFPAVALGCCAMQVTAKAVGPRPTSSATNTRDVNARVIPAPEPTCSPVARVPTHDYIPPHVREGHPEQRSASLCHRRWHERARQPHAQLSAAVERRAEPRLAGHPPQSQDRRGIARSAALGPDPVLVQ